MCNDVILVVRLDCWVFLTSAGDILDVDLLARVSLFRGDNKLTKIGGDLLSSERETIEEVMLMRVDQQGASSKSLSPLLIPLYPTPTPP